MKCLECNEEINMRTAHIMLTEWRKKYPEMTTYGYHKSCYDKSIKTCFGCTKECDVTYCKDCIEPEATPLPHGVEKEKEDFAQLVRRLRKEWVAKPVAPSRIEEQVDKAKEFNILQIEIGKRVLDELD